jgi:hypothetical protein
MRPDPARTHRTTPPLRRARRLPDRPRLLPRTDFWTILQRADHRIRLRHRRLPDSGTRVPTARREIHLHRTTTAPDRSELDTATGRPLTWCGSASDLQILHAEARDIPSIWRSPNHTTARGQPLMNRRVRCMALSSGCRVVALGRSMGCPPRPPDPAAAVLVTGHSGDLPARRGDNGDVIDDLAGRDSCGVSSIRNSPIAWHRGGALGERPRASSGSTLGFVW